MKFDTQLNGPIYYLKKREVILYYVIVIHFGKRGIKSDYACSPSSVVNRNSSVTLFMRGCGPGYHIVSFARNFLLFFTYTCRKNERKHIELNRVNVGRAFELNRITIGGTDMQQSPSPTKSASFIKRNSTSQQWYSQSVPNTSYMKLYNGHASQGHQSRHSHSTRVPRSIPTSRSETPNRPESAASYSNDGGVFLPNKPKHEYFVIHPDWVSESMTIQKLSLSERKPTFISKSGTWPGRRCKSAPPSKFRNPITWNVESNT